MNLKKSISLVLTLCMVFSLFATFVFPVAAEGTTYTLIDTVEDLTAGTYYMGGVVTNDSYGPYQIFSGSVGTQKENTDLHTSLYTYTDGVLATESTFPAAAVVLAAVEGKENTYTIYVDGKGYITCTGVKRALNFSDTACEWVVSNNAKGGITFSTTVSGSATYMGINQGTGTGLTTSKFIRNYSGEGTLTSGLVFFAEDVEEEAPVISKVVTCWNADSWQNGYAGEGVGAEYGAYIYTDADIYANVDMGYWIHVAFAPVADNEGVYEVAAIRGPSESAPYLTIPENGFVWTAWTSAGDSAESAGAFALSFMNNLKVGNWVKFTGLDIAEQTTTEDATAEVVIDPNAPVNVALNKNYAVSGLENSTYNAKLTDGNAYGAMTYDNKWFAFLNANMSDNVGYVIVNLGGLYDISKVQANLVNDSGAGVVAPEYVKVFVSVNAVDWEEAGALPTSTAEQTAYWAALSDLSVTAQYVKIEIKKAGTFAFINEVEVYGKESAETVDKGAHNAAFLKDYTISGCGEPYDKYAANLTDALAYQEYKLDANWFAFYNNGTHPGDNAPDKVGTIVIDLGEVFDIASVKVNALDAQGASGIKAPAGFKAYLSEDGENWGEAITLSYTLPAEQGAFVAESAVSGKAKFVKVEVSLDGVFAFINEIEVWTAEEDVPVEEDDDSFKDTYTYVDGVNKGTAQSREDGWESIPVVDFWYLVEDGVDTVTIKIAVDNKKVVEDDTQFRVWIDADLSTTNARTTLIDTKVKDGAAYVARVDAEMGAAILEQTYSVIGNDYFFTLVLDKAVIGIDGQYGLNLQLGQTGHNTLHSIEWDAFDSSLVPWSTTEFYEVFGDADTFKDTYTHVDGEIVGTTQSRGEGWESLLVPDFWYVVEDGETEVTIKVAVDNRVIAADDTMLRVWIDADPSDTARTTLIDTKVKDGAAYVARVDGGLDAAILSQTYSVDGNDYFLTVVLDKAALGIDGQYGMLLTLSETGYNSMHNVAWDVEDVAGAAPWNTTKDYILYGEAPEVDYNEVVVDVNANAMLTDGKTGFAGGWNVGADANKVLLIANSKCTTNPMKVVVNYALGETKAINALVLDFYHCAGVMIGYPEGKVLVEYSVDGTEYVALGEYDLEAVTLSTAADGTVSSTLEFDAVDAAYVRATFVVGSNKDVLGNSPADGKIFWEFAALAEVAVSEAPAAPEYDTGWNVEYDDTQIKILSGNEAFVAALTDNVWAEGATSFGTAGVLLVQNLVCKNPDLYPELTLVYNAGTAIDVNNIKVGLYVETNSMIGYPSEDAKVYVSTDGIEWTPVDSTTDIPESVFVQHGNSENSLGTYVANIEFATSTAQYVKVVFTYTDSPFNDPNGDYKPVYEFIGFTEAEVSYVEPTEELPEDATGLDIYGYTHTHINYVMYVDADMTLGELVTKYFGQSKDLNYFKVIVVNEDGTVAATYLTLGRPDGVKTDIAVTAGQYVLALSADGSNTGRFEIADTVKVGDIVTLYNVDFTAEPGELTNAGFTVEAAVKDLPSGRGFEVLVPANGSVSYVANFTNGADFMLYDTSVTVLVNGVALDASEGYYEAKLEKGDVVTFENATGEDIAVYPMAFPVIYGTMSNPFVLEELGDLTADITMELIMNGGAAHYIYTAPADGKVTVTMLDASWTYTVNNLTAGLYGDAQWSDSDPVLKSYTIEVSEGDDIQIIVGTYDAENPWAAPEGKVNFTVAFEAAKTFVTGEFSEGGELNKANAFAANAHNIWNKDFSGNSWWGVTVLEWNAEENAWEVVKVLLSGADAKDGTLTETQIALAAHVDNAAAYAAITALQVGDIVYIWDAGVATTDKLVDGVDANGGFYTTDPEKTGTTALTYKKVEFLAGDANMNGKIDANDYATIRKLVVGSLTAEDVDAKTLELADVNGNGKIDANDYLLVKRHVLGTYTIPAWEDVE